MSGIYIKQDIKSNFEMISLKTRFKNRLVTTFTLGVNLGMGNGELAEINVSLAT